MLDLWRRLLGNWVQSNKLGLWVVGSLVAIGGILILFEATEFVGYSFFIFAVLGAWILWPRKPKGGGGVGGEGGSGQTRTREAIVLGLAVGIVLTIVGFGYAAGAEGSVVALYPMFAGLAILAVILLLGIAQFIRNLQKRKR